MMLPVALVKRVLVRWTAWTPCDLLGAWSEESTFAYTIFFFSLDPDSRKLKPCSMCPRWLWKTKKFMFPIISEAAAKEPPRNRITGLTSIVTEKCTCVCLRKKEVVKVTLRQVWKEKERRKNLAFKFNRRRPKTITKVAQVTASNNW